MLTGIVVLGLGLRLYRLDALGFAGNEDYLVIAVRGVLATGAPEFPSGIVYPRAPPLTYLAAGTAALLGPSELALRLPSVLFSTLSIVLVYLLAARWISVRVALLAALLMAISDWEIQVGRTARMYSMLSATCLLSVWLLDRALVARGRWPGAAAALSTALACWTHQLGLAVGVMYACFPTHFGLDRRQLRLIGSCLLVAVVSAGAYRLVSSRQYDRWDAAVESARGSVWEEAPDVRGDLREEISSRYLGPWRALRSAGGGLFTGLTALALGALGALAFAAWRYPRERLLVAAAALLVGTLYLQQLALAAIVIAVYAALGRQLQPEGYRIRALVLGSVLAAAGLGWLLFALLVPAGPAAAGDPAGAAGALKSALKALLGYPPNFFKLFAERYPAMSALAFCALVVAAARYLSSGRVGRLGLLALLFVAPALALGFHPRSIGRTLERYVFFLDPFFLMLAAFGAVWLGERLWVRMSGRGPLRGLAVSAYVVLLVVATGFANLRAAVACVTAGYGSNGGVRDLEDAGSFYPDLAGPALFVKAKLRPDDVVAAMDVLGSFAYLPRIDYQVSLFGKPDAEGWLGARSLASAGELAAALERHRGRRVWVVLSATHLRKFDGDPRMDAILRLVEERAGEPRYRGRDGLSDVYLIAPRIPLPPNTVGEGRRRPAPARLKLSSLPR